MWLVALTLPALALPVEILAAVQPGPDAVGVPTDVSPVLVFMGDCTTDAPYRVRVTGPNGEVVHDVEYDQFDDFQIVGDGALLELDLPLLQPSTRYEVVAEAAFGARAAYGFTTGQGPLGQVEGVPVITLGSVRSTGTDQTGWSIEADLALNPAGPGGSIFVVHSDGADRTVLNHTGVGPHEATAAWFTTEHAADDACVSVVERAANGQRLGPSNESCTTSAERAACATIPTPGGLLLLGATALALRARRR